MKLLRLPWRERSGQNVPLDESICRAEELADKLTGLVIKLEQHLEGSASEPA